MINWQYMIVLYIGHIDNLPLFYIISVGSDAKLIGSYIL